MSDDLTKTIESAAWPDLLQAAVNSVNRNVGVLKSDAGAVLATPIYMFLTAVEKFLPAHIALVEELTKTAKQTRENARRLDEMRKEIDALDKHGALPIVRQAGLQKDKFAPVGELTESDTTALRSVAVKTDSPADRRILENLANVEDMKRTLAARDGK